MKTLYPKKCEHGTWVYQTDRNLDGIYDDYTVTVGGENRLVNYLSYPVVLLVIGLIANYL